MLRFIYANTTGSYWQNTTNDFVLIIGSVVGESNTDTFILQVLAQDKLTPVDQIINHVMTLGSPTTGWNTQLQYLPKKLLVPPNFWLNTEIGGFQFIALTGQLDELRGFI